MSTNAYMAHQMALLCPLEGRSPPIENHCFKTFFFFSHFHFTLRPSLKWLSGMQVQLLSSSLLTICTEKKYHVPRSPELPAPAWLPAQQRLPELPAPQRLSAAPWSPELPAPTWLPKLPLCAGSLNYRCIYSLC